MKDWDISEVDMSNIVFEDSDDVPTKKVNSRKVEQKALSEKYYQGCDDVIRVYTGEIYITSDTPRGELCSVYAKYGLPGFVYKKIK